MITIITGTNDRAKTKRACDLLSKKVFRGLEPHHITVDFSIEDKGNVDAIIIDNVSIEDLNNKVFRSFLNVKAAADIVILCNNQVKAEWAHFEYAHLATIEMIN